MQFALQCSVRLTIVVASCRAGTAHRGHAVLVCFVDAEFAAIAEVPLNHVGRLGVARCVCKHGVEGGRSDDKYARLWVLGRPRAVGPQLV